MLHVAENGADNARNIFAMSETCINDPLLLARLHIV